VAGGFANENALSHHAFPSAAYFESKVISMVGSVVGGAEDARGLFCSGGTEAILLAMKAYRDKAGATGDEILVPRTAHPAFAKAAQLLGMRIRTVDVTRGGRVEPERLSAAIGDRTAVVGISAPNFPYGVLDPIIDIAAAAQTRGVGVHVDAALGGMFLPFLDSAPAFGLDVHGVTSVSVDIHKYGYAPKGGSVLLFAEATLRRAAYFVWTEWLGGAFASASAQGTRSVGASAGAFATLASLGLEGYRATVRDVMDISDRLRDGLSTRGWSIIGEPCMSVWAAAPPDAERFGGLVAGMSERGWSMDVLHEPLAFHFVVTPRHRAVLDAFFADLDESAEKATAGSLDGVASYGVVVRGERPSTSELLAHLDERYDGVM
jgi:sphinganine-1-phosphate aldolase